MHHNEISPLFWGGDCLHRGSSRQDGGEDGELHDVYIFMWVLILQVVLHSQMEMRARERDSPVETGCGTGKPGSLKEKTHDEPPAQVMVVVTAV